MIKYVMARAINAEIEILKHYFKIIKTQLLLMNFDLCLIQSNKVNKLINLLIDHMSILFVRIIEPLRENMMNPVNIWVLIFLNPSLNFKSFISSKHLIDLVKL